MYKIVIWSDASRQLVFEETVLEILWWHTAGVIVFFSINFYPRDAMLARVFAIATCLSVRRAPVLCLAEPKQDSEMYTVW